MARRPVAAVAAALLFVEAVGIVLMHVVLGRVVGGQSMSLAGLDPGLMSTSTFAMGGVFGLYLAVCGVVLLRAAPRDRGPGRFARTLLITCAVTHGVLGALAVGLVGWQAFAFMMLALGLIVLSLIGYDRGLPAPAAPEDAGAPGRRGTGRPGTVPPRRRDGACEERPGGRAVRSGPQVRDGDVQFGQQAAQQRQ